MTEIGTSEVGATARDRDRESGVKSLILTNGAMSKEPLAMSIEQGARSEEHGAKVISVI